MNCDAGHQCLWTDNRLPILLVGLHRAALDLYTEGASMSVALPSIDFML